MRAIWLILIPALVLSAPMGMAQTVEPTIVSETTPKKGLFAANHDKRAERAAARDARKAEREARKAARAQKAALRKSGTSADVGSGKDIETAVQYAIDNKPKGRWWCVPFARMVSGVDIRGNAKLWWEAAKGHYARGQEPKVGAVMAFAASRAMPKGHVAVVSQVVSDREIKVVHANWERARVTLHDLVVDVSEAGDWSRVRVENSQGSLGRINPVNGFIYN